MLDFRIDTAAADILCHEHSPVEMRMLSQVVNLIIQPTGIKFRLIQNVPGARAILSSETVHVAISFATKPLQTSAFDRTAVLQNDIAGDTDLEKLVAEHQQTVSIRVGNGPVPSSVRASGFDFPIVEADLKLLILETATNHLVNCHPQSAVFWQPTGRIMRAKAFLDALNDEGDFGMMEGYELSADTHTSLGQNAA